MLTWKNMKGFYLLPERPMVGMSQALSPLHALTLNFVFCSFPGTSLQLLGSNSSISFLEVDSGFSSNLQVGVWQETRKQMLLFCLFFQFGVIPDSLYCIGILSFFYF